MSKAAFAQSRNMGMDTEMTHTVFGRHAEEAIQAAGVEIRRLERLLSRFVPEGQISRINGSAGINREKVSHETFGLLSRAAEFSNVGRGFFTITIGPLVDLWDVKNASAAPEDTRITEILALVSDKDLILDPVGMTAGLRKAGQSIDLGGIGKGFAGDKIVEIFKKLGIVSALTNLGGNVVALGAKPDGTPWRVGIRHPREENRLIGAVDVVDQAVVTSGDYQRYFIDSKGKRYPHILDPHTGYPSQSGLISVTVIAADATTADAMSTLLFVAGMKSGLIILRSYPDVQAVFVDTEMRVFITRGLKGSFRTDARIHAYIVD